MKITKLKTLIHGVIVSILTIYASPAAEDQNPPKWRKLYNRFINNESVINSVIVDGTEISPETIDVKLSLALPIVPDNIGKANWITVLDLSKNQLTTLPDTLKNLKRLEVLKLHQNQLEIIPKCIKKLKTLKELYFGCYDTVSPGNKLTIVPDWIGNLTALEKLDFYKNELTKLPNTIEKLTKLKALILDGNKLTELPLTIGNLKNLESLLLGRNQLTFLPNCIGSLTALLGLHISQNELTELPYTIGNLTLLRELRIRENKLINLPCTIGNLRKLTTLSLEDNKLSTLPDSFYKLKELICLNLVRNPLIGEEARWAFFVSPVILKECFSFYRNSYKKKEFVNIIGLLLMGEILPKDLIIFIGSIFYNLDLDGVYIPKDSALSLNQLPKTH